MTIVTDYIINSNVYFLQRAKTWSSMLERCVSGRAGGVPTHRGRDPERDSFVDNVAAKIDKMTPKRWRTFEPICQALMNW